MILWFEDDLFDALLLAQIEDRLAARGNGTGAGPVTRVRLRHPPRGDLAAALAAREPVDPDPAAFAALRSPDPRAWTAVPAFARLLEELPDSRTGLSRLERQILEALADGPLTPARSLHGRRCRRGPTLGRRRDGVRPRRATSTRSSPSTPAATSSRPTAPPSSREPPPAHRSTAGSEASTSARGRPDWVWDATAPPPRPARADARPPIASWYAIPRIACVRRRRTSGRPATAATGVISAVRPVVTAAARRSRVAGSRTPARLRLGRGSGRAVPLGAAGPNGAVAGRRRS